MTSAPRILVAALVGGLAAAIALVTAFSLHPAIAFEMDRDLPRIAFGFYPPEASAGVTFAWTAERAQLNLVGLDRRTDWRCTIVFRGARPEGIAQPTVSVAIDGAAAASRTATNEYQTLDVVAFARKDRPGLNLSMLTSPTFVPGPSDPRPLGVQVDRIVCAPAEAVIVLPPRRSIADAALTAGLFGLAFVLAGATTWSAIGGAIAVAIAQSAPLSSGPAPYGPFAGRALWLGIWIALTMVVIVRSIELTRRQRLTAGARFAAAFSAGALFVKLLGLMHPSKLIIDAVFHAHRLEWVMGGRYFFTQPMPNGVEFPYAIALYVAAVPWTALAHDHVALLRILVCGAEAGAGSLLYWMVVRNWDDRLTGAIAVLLFTVVPLPFVVLGNANLTNAFGQSAALVAMAMAATLDLRRIVQVGALMVVTAIALLSHVGTFGALGVELVALAIFYWSIGGRAMRPAAISVLAATVAAVVLSVVVYYGHFVEVYRHLNQVTAEPGATAAAASLMSRLSRSVAVSASDLGWPILVLAATGLWRLVREGGRDRLTCTLAAYGLTYVVFAAFGIALPLGASFERYVVEFISRIDYATYPAAVILAARGVAWLWRHGRIGRAATVVLVELALAGGVTRWLGWFH